MRELLPRPLLLRIIPVWILVLIIGSLMPGDAKKSIGTMDHIGPTAAIEHVTSGHRLYHFVSFGSTALLLLLAASTLTEEVAAALGTILLGILLEFAQHWIYRGELEWWDIRDDSIGIALAATLIQWKPVRTVLLRTRS